MIKTVVLLLFCGALLSSAELSSDTAPTIEAGGSVRILDQATSGQTQARVLDAQRDESGNAAAESSDLQVRIPLGGRDGLSNAVKILLFITVLSIAPGFLVMMTSFTRIIVILGFVRRALGTQTLPPNQVMLGLALFLTLFTMAPTLQTMYTEAVEPYMEERITEAEAIEISKNTVRDFMIAHTRKTDLALFIKIAGEERPRTVDDVSFTTLVPAFVTSELKTAFQMGFVIFLPFIVIDLVISAILMALGMMMLPPVVISLPFKILLFALVDGWALLMQSLAASYI